MTHSRQNPSIRTFPTNEWIGTLLFFAAYFAITLWLINPALHYHALGPAFLQTTEFFTKFTTYPGGLIEYCASYGELWFQYPLVGACISTLMTWLVCEATRHYLKTVRREASPYPWSLVPAFFLIAMQSRLEFPWLDTALGYFVCVAALAIYCRLPLKNAALRLCVYAVLLAIIYGLAGAMALILAVGAAAYESAGRKSLLLGGITLLLGSAIPWLATFIYVIHVQDAYLFKLAWNRPQPGMISPWLLYISLPVTGLAMAWMARPKEAAPATTPIPVAKKTAKKQNSRNGFVSKFVLSASRALQNPIAPALLFTLSALIWFDGPAKKLGQINARSRQKDWNGVLEAARNLRACPSYAVADINRALCQQGRLLDTMFAYPQRADYALWLHFHDTMDERQSMKASDILFDLGQISKAERMAGESLELNGYRPETLWRLFHINVLKNEPDTARVFLTMLNHCPSEKWRVARVRTDFSRDSALSGNEELARIRSLMLKEDYYGDHRAIDILTQSLRRNPANLLALQYLLAHHLINQDLDAIEKNLSLFNSVNLPQLPRHIQEALLIQQKLTKGRPLELGKWQISPETSRAFEDFHQRFMRFAGNLQAASEDLRADYGDTYWFFYMFAVSGSASEPNPHKAGI